MQTAGTRSTVEDQVRKFKIISIHTFYFDCLSGCAKFYFVRKFKLMQPLELTQLAEVTF